MFGKFCKLKILNFDYMLIKMVLGRTRTRGPLAGLGQGILRDQLGLVKFELQGLS